MRLFFNKLKITISAFAVVSLMICSICTVSADAVKGFNKASVYSFCSDTENTYSKPGGTAVSSGTLSWQLYDTYDSKINNNGLYVTEGYLKLRANNPLNMLSDFRIEIVYSSSETKESAEDKPFLLLSTKKYSLIQLMTDSSVLIGITENGNVYHMGQKINHADGSKTADFLTSKNSGINPNDECKLTVKYIGGKLTVTLTYNGGKTTVKLVENYQCEISKLQQFILGGDKSNRIAGVTYKSISVSEYGEYIPSTESGLKAVVQTGEVIKEYTDSDTALNNAISQSKNGMKPVLMLYTDIILKKPITVDAGKSLTVDLNGHTINRNCHGTMISDGYVFLVGSGASLTIEDSSPDVQNYSTAIHGGVITGGAGDGAGGGIQLKEKSRLTMTGGTVVGCITNDHGGAVRVDGGGVKINLSNAGFYSNMTLDSADNSHGGAIYSDYSDCEVNAVHTVFEGNYSEDNGGAVYINDGKFTAEDCLFSGNKCLDDGGAVYVESGSKATFNKCVFANNRSESHAGAIFCNSSAGTRISGTFKNNSAGGAGGALFINGNAVSIQDAYITGNVAGDRGGAMYVDEMYDINIQGILKVKDNYKTNKSRDDIFLDSIGIATARIYNGGLYDGSEVWVLTASSSQIVSEYISSYQQRYFYCDDSSKTLQFVADNSKTIRQNLITSAIGSGNILFIIITVAAVILAVAVTVIIKSKKRGADKNEKKA